MKRDLYLSLNGIATALIVAKSDGQRLHCDSVSVFVDTTMRCIPPVSIVMAKTHKNPKA